MSTSGVQCPVCKATVLDFVFNQQRLAPCPSCSAPIRIDVFPALFRRITSGRDGDALMVDGESSCFYHPAKKAVIPCEGCGRFLCALCDCELQGRHYCPACLEIGKTKGKIQNLESRRFRYDSIALSLAVLPMLVVFLFYITIITAPMSLYIAIRYWKAPLSIVHRNRIRFVIAILISAAQIAGWVIVGLLIFYANG
jgi:hypothetical protein